MSGYGVLRGRNLLNTPGPTNVPERVQQAMVRNPMDLGDPRALSMIETCFQDLKKIFQTEHEIFIYAANGHGAWEAALVNTLSPGDLLLVPELGNFSTGWGEMAEALQMRTETIKGDWRQAIDPATLPCSLSTPSRLSRSPISGWTNGVSTSLSALHRKA